MRRSSAAILPYARCYPAGLRHAPQPVIEPLKYCPWRTDKVLMPRFFNLRNLMLLLSLASIAVFVSIAALGGRAEAAVSAGDTPYVDVTAATLWSQPGSARPVDRPALANPANLNGWLGSMSKSQKDDLIYDSRTQTQALYGQRVRVLSTSGGWAKVAVPTQATPKNSKGYPGWVPKRQLASGTKAAFKGRPMAKITKPRAGLFENRALSDRMIPLSFGTRLPVIERAPGRIRVATPSGPNGWISSRAASVHASPSSIPEPTPKKLEQTARKFLGLEYLWAGTSGFAFDCSGFTHQVYRSHGINLPRDAGDQRSRGKPVVRANLEKGDLVFFGNQSGVYHMGMYLENGKMIHASNRRSSDVRIEKITQSSYNADYAGARRYL